MYKKLYSHNSNPFFQNATKYTLHCLYESQDGIKKRRDDFCPAFISRIGTE